MLAGQHVSLASVAGSWDLARDLGVSLRRAMRSCIGGLSGGLHAPGACSFGDVGRCGGVSSAAVDSGVSGRILEVWWN